ncbi:MAG TPA: cache domain-containing protein [Rubrivivax sp.]|nr:cache domain-containing protein [Rubrivivax sp.]
MNISRLNRRQTACLLAGAALLCAGQGFAASEQQLAIAMTEKAAAALKAQGKAKLIERVNAKDPEFAAGEIYAMVLQASDGVMLAHPINPKLIGKAMLDVPDPDGKLFRKERLELGNGKGKGWVDYKYKNPVSNKIEAKTAYVLKVDDVIISVGVYKD